MIKKDKYKLRFFESLKDFSGHSAREIIPIILRLVKPKSVVDVGCGVGVWLSIYKEYGINDILGIDGDYVDKELLVIPKRCFMIRDLEKPFKLKRKFDLVSSTEVGEHLSKESSKAFVNSLVRLGSVIIFSAAIPYQGGTNHINEQWQDYWVDLFKKKNYILVDCIRNKIWDNEIVNYFYAQNMLMFVEENYLNKSKVLKKELKYNKSNQIRLVHPRRYLMIAKDRERFTKLIPKFVKNTIRILKNKKLKH